MTALKHNYVVQNLISFEAEIPNEIGYADDVDFILQNYADIKKIQEVLEKYQLKVNPDKTE